MICTDDSYIRSILFKRKRDSHKGDYGRLLLFAGSPGMAGAAILCARAALKTGAGLVQFLLPDLNSPLLTILQTAVPEATCLDGSSVRSLSGFSAIAAGSGIGRSAQSLKILTRILEGYRGTLVLDADALNLMAENEDLADRVRAFPGDVILTPHIGEAKRLLHTREGISGDAEREWAACALAEQYRCIAVLKGAGTLIACRAEDAAKTKSPEKPSVYHIYQNTTGNPGMATAGSGDTLTGLIASLAGQGYAPADAARAGVFLHGRAGDLAAAQLGEMSVTASDIIRFIPDSLKEYCPA